jgi:hypothetical protein
MDIIQALQYLNTIKSSFNQETYQEAVDVLNRFEGCLQELSNIYEQVEGKQISEFMQLIAKYEIIKQDILTKVAS